MNYGFRSLCFVLIFFLSYSLAAQQEIKLTKRTGSSAELLTDLVKIHKLNLSFNPADCNNEKKIELPATKMKIEEMLSLICKEGNLRLQKIGGQYIITKNRTEAPIIKKPEIIEPEDNEVKVIRQTVTFSFLNSSNENLLSFSNTYQQTGLALPVRIILNNKDQNTLNGQTITTTDSGTFLGNLVFSNAEWGILGGINTSDPQIVNDYYGFFAGFSYQKQLPFHFYLSTSFDFFKKTDIVDGFNHKNIYLKQLNGYSTSFNVLEVVNRFYGINFPMTIIWKIPNTRISPYLGGGFFGSYSIWGTSNLRYQKVDENNIYNYLSVSHNIDWNSPSASDWADENNYGEKLLYNGGYSVMNRNNYGWILQAGLSFHRVDLRVAYVEGLKNDIYYFKEGQSKELKLSLTYSFKFKTATAEIP